MNTIIPGSIVVIKNLSKPSHYLYKKYLQICPTLICPCVLKRDILLIVDNIFDHGEVILKGKKHNIITMVYLDDLSLVFEN